MKRLVIRTFAGTLLLAAALVAAAPAALAQSEPPPPTPVVVVGNTRFVPLFERVTVAPGERVARDLDVAHFSRISILAAAESAPNDGRIAVATIFGPPEVPVPNPLTLAFNGGTSVRRAATLGVMGPHLTVAVANLSRQPVEVSLSVFASK